MFTVLSYKQPVTYGDIVIYNSLLVCYRSMNITRSKCCYTINL